MARASREHPPTGSGPGRGTPRSRTAARPAHRANAPARTRATASEVPPEPEAPASRVLPRLSRGLRLTNRAVAIILVSFVLVLMYASSIKVYFAQQSEIARHEASIRQHERDIADLQDQVARWQDPNYVKAQARDRLGWVMPGEVGYKVIGSDGQLLAPIVRIDSSSTLPQGEHPTTWWERLTTSIAVADNPAPAKDQPATVTVSSSPSPKPSPSPSR